MSRILISLMITLFSFSTFADESVKALEQKTKIVKDQTAKISPELKKAEKQLTAAEESVNLAKAELDKAREAHTKKAGGVGIGKYKIFEGEGTTESKKNVEAAEKKFKLAQEKVDALEPKVEKLREAKADLVTELKTTNKDMASANNAFVAALEAGNVTEDFNVLKLKMGNTEAALDRMNSQYDKAILGAYLKDKIGLLLNSQLICQARSRCDVKNPVEIKNEDVQNVLFPGSNSSTREKSYYEKINGKPADSKSSN